MLENQRSALELGEDISQKEAYSAAEYKINSEFHAILYILFVNI